MLVLVANNLAYLFTFLFFMYKDKELTIRVLILFLFTLFATASTCIVWNGIFFEQFGYYNIERMSYIPYVCNYALILFFIQSILKKKRFGMGADLANIKSKYVTYFEIFIILISLIQILIQYDIYLMISHLDLNDIYEDSHFGDLEIPFGNSIERILYYRSKNIIEISTPFIYLIEFSKLAYGKAKKFPIIIIALIFLPAIIGCFIMANRGGVLFNTASIAFFVVLFWNKLDHKTLNIIRILILVTGVFVVFYVTLITLSRSNNDTNKAIFDAMRYFGEGFPNLGLRFWDHYCVHPYGMRHFPSIYGIFKPLPQIESGLGNYHQFYIQYTHLPVLNFKTFYGDLYIEFGYIIPFFIVLLYVLFIKSILNKLKGSIYYLIIYYFAYMTMIWALFGSKITDEYIYNIIVAYLIIIVVRKLMKKTNKSKQRIYLIYNQN